ncbi:MAG TPA: glycoside hydrolase family 3 protein [Chloroflexota bacterium]|nr:glycoside hydrolase family 3 protein [Chloroflexota bacterium]
MSECVGQLIWAFITSRDDLEPAARAAREGRIGGVWLLPTEMRSATETAALINWLQASSPQPLLIGVDAEAGVGLVMGGATLLPTAMALGAAGDPQLTCEAARVTAAEARACGINTIAAPVLDVNVNPANPIINTRAFGGSPELVGRLGSAFLRELMAPPLPDHGGASGNGSTVLPIGKHFPGHGDTRQDSHLDLETLAQPRDRLEAVELAPFRQAIAASVPLLMTAHVAYPALDPAPGIPATLSRPILTDLLREELGFQGAVVTDCMNMHAIAHNFDGRAAVVRSVEAGCDLVLTDQWDAAYEALDRAHREGRLSESRVSEAVERVRTVKLRIFGPGPDGSPAHPRAIQPEVAQVSIGTPLHAAVAERIAAASITLVDGTLMKPGDRALIVATRMARRFGPAVEVQLRAALTALGRQDVDVLMVDPMPDAGQIDTARARAAAADWAALLHFNRVQSFDPEAVLASDELVSLAGAMAGTGVPTTVVSMGSPYALPLFSRATARVCSYSTCDASLHATLRVLLEGEPARGSLPVALTPPVASALPYSRR